MPQLDFATYSSQFFWLTICLSVLYIFIAKVFIPKIESAITARKKRIEGLLEDAQKLRDDAESMNHHYIEDIKKVHLDAYQIHKNAIKNFEEQCALQLEQMKQEHEIKINELSKEIQRLEENFEYQMTSQAELLINSMMTKITQVEYPKIER